MATDRTKQLLAAKYDELIIELEAQLKEVKQLKSALLSDNSQSKRHGSIAILGEKKKSIPNRLLEVIEGMASKKYSMDALFDAVNADGGSPVSRVSFNSAHARLRKQKKLLSKKISPGIYRQIEPKKIERNRI